MGGDVASLVFSSIAVLCLFLVWKCCKSLFSWESRNKQSRHGVIVQKSLRLDPYTLDQQSRYFEPVPESARLEPYTLDLHGYSVKDAKSALRTFLSNARSRKHSTVFVNTGWGRHSDFGEPKIKPMVQGYLDDGDYSHRWENDGRVIIYLKSDVDLSSSNAAICQ